MGAAFACQHVVVVDAAVDPETIIDVALDAAAEFDRQIRGKWTGLL